MQTHQTEVESLLADDIDQDSDLGVHQAVHADFNPSTPPQFAEARDSLEDSPPMPVPPAPSAGQVVVSPPRWPGMWMCVCVYLHDRMCVVEVTSSVSGERKRKGKHNKSGKVKKNKKAKTQGPGLLNSLFHNVSLILSRHAMSSENPATNKIIFETNTIQNCSQNHDPRT